MWLTWEGKYAVAEKVPTKSSVLETSSTDNTELAEENAPKQEYIRYVGSASRREITQEDWAAIGVKATKDTNWTFANDFKLPKKDFPPEALKYLLNTPGETNFRVVTE